MTVTDNESTNENNKIIFGAGAAGSGNIGLEADGDLTYNPSVGTLSSTRLTVTDSVVTELAIRRQSNTADLILRRDNVGDLINNEVIGRVRFQATEESNSNYTVGAAVLARTADAWDRTGGSCPADLEFWTASSGATSTTEKMAILANGNVGIGYSSSDITKKLSVNGQIKSDAITTSGGIYRLGMTNNTKFLQCTAGNNDVEVLRVSNDSTTLNAFNFGFSLVYSGSGSGNNNTFQLMSDNQDTGPREPVWTAYQDGKFQIGASGARVTTILDENAMGSNSDTALATQSSIKAYVDNEISGVGGGTATGVTAGAEVGNTNSAPAALNIKQSNDSQTQGGLYIESQDNNTKSMTMAVKSSNKFIMTMNQNTAHGAYLQTGGGWSSNSGLFTGQHRSKAETKTPEEMNQHIGEIVVANGYYDNYDNEGTKPTINTSHPIIKLSDKRMQKSVYGVVAKREGSTREFDNGTWMGLHGETGDDERIVVNSLGEGGIWVCNINGNLENGDYITTCEVPGLGMKQDSEMLCNYTVAKITQDCNFRKNAVNYDVEEFEFEGKTYRKAFVGCTYHCG